MTFNELKTKLKKDPARSYWTDLQRKLGLFVTVILIKIKPNANPNFVTISMLLFNIIAFIFLYFGITQERYFILIGFSIHFFSDVLDCVDGNLARIQNITSIKGVIYDRLVHNFSHPLFFLIIGFGFYNITQNLLYLIIYITISIFSELSPIDVAIKDVQSSFIKQKTISRTQNFDLEKHLSQNTYEINESKRNQKASPLYKIIRALFSFYTFYLIIFIELVLLQDIFIVSTAFAILFLIGKLLKSLPLSKQVHSLETILYLTYLSDSKNTSCKK